MANVVTIKWKLRSVMADRKMTSIKLAGLMGVSRITIQAWKSSDEIPAFKNPGETIDDLCKFLKCTVADLIERDGDRL